MESDNPHICQVMAGATHGGAETFFERLVPALARAGQRQSVILRRNAARSALLRDVGLVPRELRFGGKLDLATRLRLPRILRISAPDIVLSWMSRAATMVPKGNYVHCARLGGYYRLKYYQTCDHLIGNTREIVNYLVREGWPVDRAHYLPNFVPDIKGQPLDRSEYSTPEEAPLILALGRLHENKAFDVLFRSMIRNSDAYLWVAGTGPQEASLRQLAEDLSITERVRLLGWRDDSHDLIATADLVAVPSRIEALGNVVLEAWAQSKPLVAARSAGPAALIEDGVDGLLCDVEDADQLADAASKIIGDRGVADALAGAGREKFERKFTEAAVVAQYQDFFHRIANR